MKVAVLRTVCMVNGCVVEEIALDGDPGFFQLRLPGGDLVKATGGGGEACFLSLVTAQRFAREHVHCPGGAS